MENHPRTAAAITRPHRRHGFSAPGLPGLFERLPLANDLLYPCEADPGGAGDHAQTRARPARVKDGRPELLAGRVAELSRTAELLPSRGNTLELPLHGMKVLRPLGVHLLDSTV